MVPPPRKPIPTTIWLAMRVGSAWMPERDAPVKAWNPYALTTVKRHAPSATRIWVRNPAGWSRHSRSSPINPPKAAATRIRTATSASWIIAAILRPVGRDLRQRRIRQQQALGALRIEMHGRLRVGSAPGDLDDHALPPLLLEHAIP